MDKQCLDLKQMQHLQELGLEVKDTMMYWARCVDNNPRAATHYGKWVLIKGNSAQTVGLMHWEFVPAFTLQDVLSVLPEWIYVNTEQYLLEINLFYKYIRYSRLNHVLCKRYFNRTSLLDAAYELLLWAIENGFMEALKAEFKKKEK